MLTHEEARTAGRAAAPNGYRLHTITQGRPGRFATLYVDDRWRSWRGTVTADGASVARTVYGPKFRRSEDEREVQVAARIRADFRKARGMIPAHLRISVDVSGLTDRFLSTEREAGAPHGREAMALELIYGAYQRDGSDSPRTATGCATRVGCGLLSEAQQAETVREEEAKRRKAGGATSGR